MSFGYDNLDRLTGWAKYTSSRVYAYDANGNREDLVSFPVW